MAVAKRSIASQTVAQRYLLTKQLGSGTYGDVYLATDLELDRQVAIKVLRDEYADNEASVQRFLREARFAARIPPHPNIVTVFDLVREDDLLCIVLEYVEGSDLRRVIAKEAPLPLDDVVPTMEGILRALAAAHERDIIHRDVKPANVLLDKMNTVKLTDFGIAQALMDSVPSSEDGVPGTAAYMAPEQIRNEPVGAQADLYAAGIILFELLTGRRLFAAATSVDVAIKHLKSRVPSPRALNPEIPYALETVILRALEKNWRDRYADASEMLEALRASSTTPAQSTRPKRDSRPVPLHAVPGAPRPLGQNEPSPSSEGTEILPHVELPTPSMEEAVNASERRSGDGYQSILRALGAFLDQEPSDHVTLLEVDDGFFLRRQRAITGVTEVVTQHVTVEILQSLLARLKRERPRNLKVRRTGLWSSFPQGHQDFFRALGHELDTISARALLIDQDDDSLTLTYQRPRADGTCCEKHITVLRVKHIEEIINAAFDRRRNPSRRLGLERIPAETRSAGGHRVSPS